MGDHNTPHIEITNLTFTNKELICKIRHSSRSKGILIGLLLHGIEVTHLQRLADLKKYIYKFPSIQQVTHQAKSSRACKAQATPTGGIIQRGLEDSVQRRPASLPDSLAF